MRDKDGKKYTVLKSIWVFKLKRLPDGTPDRYKARFCVRGDMQKEGIDFFDTYAPVVKWSTIRMLLIETLSRNWTTRQVDFTNAFAQGVLSDIVYIDPLKGFEGKDGKNKVLRLIKSLYGIRQSAKMFFEKLRDGLLERGFKQSQHDPCLFMKKNLMCVVYVDDMIMSGPDGIIIENEIKSLRIHDREKRHTFELKCAGEVNDFLEIRIEKLGKKQFNLTQSGLINKTLSHSKMESCKPVSTPAVTTPLGRDIDGKTFSESWDYASIVGMLMYLGQNTRPDIAFAVHQCARFTHSPRHSHAVGVKRIIRYLQGTKDKGMILNPDESLQADCYVDAHFAGLWGVENDQDPTCVKSRTGYLITYKNCSLHWASKLQSLIALSAMEAEYIALSQSMRELIPLRETIKELQELVFSSKISDLKTSTISKAFQPVPQSKVFEDNKSCLRLASLGKMSPRTKHIAIPYHFFRSKIDELEIKVLSIDTKEQLADQFTKVFRSHSLFIFENLCLVGDFTCSEESQDIQYIDIFQVTKYEKIFKYI